MKQNGFAHILMIVLLIVGLAAAIYLVQQKTNIFPKAESLLPPNPAVSDITCTSTTVSWKGSIGAIVVGTADPIKRWKRDVPPSFTTIKIGDNLSANEALWGFSGIPSSEKLEFEQKPGKTYYVWTYKKVGQKEYYSQQPAGFKIPDNCGINQTGLEPSPTPTPDMSGISKIPVNLSVSCGTGNMANLYWDSVEGASYYKIKIFDQSGNMIFEDKQTTDNNPYSFVTNKNFVYGGWQVSACRGENNCSGDSFISDGFTCPKMTPSQ